MSKDPAFLFYPGDYLRDTQCLSESAQVAYDRIMCEHMRNICITQRQLNFFIKRLNDDQKEEILMVLDKIKGGYQISWVAESIEKRKKYSDSRRKNREGKKKESNNISDSYDLHMENENEIEDINRKETEVEIWPTFNDFWDIYNKKVGSKSNVEKKFNKLNKDTKESIMNHIAEYVKATPDKRYRANPETFLNQRRWENEIINTSNLNGFKFPEQWKIKLMSVTEYQDMKKEAREDGWKITQIPTTGQTSFEKDGEQIII